MNNELQEVRKLQCMLIFYAIYVQVNVTASENTCMDALRAHQTRSYI